MAEQTNNKTIARNTIMLYFRMMFSMLVGLFTSRVILQTLGVTDYGIYQTVGGIVAFMSFLNNALATGSSRFLTYELGKNDKNRLAQTFSTTLIIHIALALIIIVVAETIGQWFLYNKLIIPDDRFSAAVFCFHLSVITAAVGVTQVPYNSSIISHEKMDLYAYAGIVETLLRLVIVYLLYIADFDKLIFYSSLQFVVTLGFQMFYRFYCVRHFAETKFKFCYDKSILKEIGKFSGWSLFSNLSIALSNQGIIVLLNMFFAPAVVAARAISLQVNGYVEQFVTNFRTAANPQIIKRYASGDFEGHKNLMVQSTKFSFFLLFIMGLPVCLTASPLLHLWLGVVPDYAVIFLQIVLIQNLFSVFDISLYQALYAKGDLKWNALSAPIINFLPFPIIYVFFKHGASPIVLSWAYLVAKIILGCIQKPYLLIKIVGYKWSDLASMYWTCFKVVVVSVPLPIIYYLTCKSLTGVEYIDFVLMAGVAVISAGLSIWFVGMDKNMREHLFSMIRSKFKKQ